MMYSLLGRFLSSPSLKSRGLQSTKRNLIPLRRLASFLLTGAQTARSPFFLLSPLGRVIFLLPPGLVPKGVHEKGRLPSFFISRLAFQQDLVGCTRTMSL